jgi:hypothetical protein
MLNFMRVFSLEMKPEALGAASAPEKSIGPDIIIRKREYSEAMRSDVAGRRKFRPHLPLCL